jgi:hypothetical protein
MKRLDWFVEFNIDPSVGFKDICSLHQLEVSESARLDDDFGRGVAFVQFVIEVD